MPESASSFPIAIPSATIVILRQDTDTPKLLMVKRRAGDAFGESYAFPGGLVDADESDSHEFSAGRTAAETDKLLSSSDALSYYCAVIRELFEETGILLVRKDEAEIDVNTLVLLQENRQKVDRGELPWSAFLQQHNLRMAFDSLHYFAHWETPLIRPKRWSTRFFLARLPEHQDATLDSNELTDIRWMSAGDIVAAAKEGSMKLPFPTLRILADISRVASVDALIAWADELAKRPVEKIRPVKKVVGGKTKWLIKGDPGYITDQ
jgi:8-oxo-dGTP pyrophosphatase MutT (NUDIX family)